MATKVFVPVVEIKNVRAHPNGDKLEICDCLGWQVCVPKGKYKENEKLIYCPPDTIIPASWADKWGIRQYLKGADKSRTGSIKLRGEASHGFLTDIPEDCNFSVGDDTAEHFGITKWNPPINSVINGGDADIPDEKMPKYTDIENLRHYPQLFGDKEIVSVTEKLHGSNCKNGITDGVEKASSMEVMRKRPCHYYLKNNLDASITQKLGDKVVELPVELDSNSIKNTIRMLKEFGLTIDFIYDRKDCDFNDPLMKISTYWFPWTIESVRNLLYGEYKERNVTQIIVYGEIFGKIQKGFEYGVKSGEYAFRAFDLMVNGKYLDVDEFRNTCSKYGVDVVPELYRGPYSIEKIKETSKGKTVLGADHIREGVVIKPLVERHIPSVGRLVLKYVSDEFLATKDGKDFTDV